MGLFGFGKKSEDIIDLTKKCKEQLDKMPAFRVSKGFSQQNLPSAFNFLGSMVNSDSNPEDKEPQPDKTEEAPVSVEEKRRRLAQRLVDITEKMENLSKQMYHLQQRIELLEKRANTGRI